MASEEDLKEYYQVPSKPLAEFNITNDKVYTLTLNENDTDTNFGNLAKLSAVPLATTTEVGGFVLYKANDGTGTATISLLNKQYGVLLRETDNVGFVYVPWLNTLYRAAPTGYLCAECISEANGHDGGLFEFDISCVPVTLISGAGDMLSGDGREHDHSIYKNVSVDISLPLQNNIDTLANNVANRITEHEAANNTKFSEVDANVDYISAYLGENYWLKTQTSSDALLKTLFTNLSDDFVSYLNNTLYTGVHTNPSYLSTETSSYTELNNKFEELSDTVDHNYMHTTDAYYQYETSSNVELNAKFDTKQDNLNIRSQINKSLPYTDNDIATVNAITSYLSSLLDEHTATFLGHFNSLGEVPEEGDSAKYTTRWPDLNDYIFVNITAADVTIPGFNFSAKDLGVWRMKIATDEWDPDKGVRNWVPEYKISDSAFTNALIAALNSGINSQLVSLIMSYAAIRNRLINEFPNMTTRFGQLALLDRITDNITGNGIAGQVAVFKNANQLTSMQFSPTKEKWRFELQDGTTYVEKYILTENV